MSNRTRWGILGTGKVAHAFARDLTTLPDAQLEAVGSRSVANADLFAETFAIPRRYGSYEALVNDGSLDIIYVASPHLFHYEHVLLCLDAGIPVLCEKPFTMNAHQAAEIVGRARERGLFAMEAMWTRYIPLVRHLRELIHDGAIGRPRIFTATLGQPPQEQVSPYLRRLDQGGGLLLDAVVYPISLAFYLLGAPDTPMGAAQFHSGGVDDQEVVVLSYSSGAFATIAATLRARIPPTFAIYGEAGSIIVEPPLFAPSAALLTQEGSQPQLLELGKTGQGYTYEAIEAMRCIRDDRRESELMPLDETIAIMSVLDDLRQQWGLTYPFEREVAIP